MRKHKTLRLALAGVLAALLLPVNALAAGETVTEKDMGLTVDYHDGETALTGAKFDLYYVASQGDHGEFVLEEPFEKYPVSVKERGTNNSWMALAPTLEGYVLRDDVPATESTTTDSQGKAYFPTGEGQLSAGLYLVLGGRHTQGGRIYDANPFMVQLPGIDEETGEPIYDLGALVKYTYREVPPPDEPDDPEPEPTPTPTPPPTKRVKALKVWNDAGEEDARPEEITVRLLRDGDEYDSVTLSADNGWRYTWEGLDNDSDWIVVEDEVEGYTVEVSQEGITFVVTNTPTTDIPDEPTPEGDRPDEPQPTPGVPEGPDVPPDEDLDIFDEDVPLARLPQTGQLWWPVPFLFCGGLVLMIAGLLRRRRYEA